MVPHASAQSGTGVIMRTCITDFDCHAAQFCARPAFMCRDCVNCTAHQLEANVDIRSCAQSIQDCGPCMSGEGCDPAPADGPVPDSPISSVYVWVSVVLVLVVIVVGATLCLCKLLKKKICAASHTAVYCADAETERGSPTDQTNPPTRRALSARSPPPNYSNAVTNNNNYIPVRPTSPPLDSLGYTSYRVPSADDQESRHMLAERSNSLHVTGLKETDLNQEAVVFRNPTREPPPSYDSLDETTEELTVEEETRESEWIANGNDEPEATGVPVRPAVDLRSLLGEARSTVLVRPPHGTVLIRPPRDVGDVTNEEPPTKLQRTGEDVNSTGTDPNESTSSAQLRITNVNATTQGSNAIALYVPRHRPPTSIPTHASAPTSSRTSGYAHHNNSHWHAGTSDYPPPNTPPLQIPRSQDRRESGNLMVNISIQQHNDVKYL